MITKKQFIKNVINSNMVGGLNQIKVIQGLKYKGVKPLHTFTLDKVLSIEEMKEFIKKYLNIKYVFYFKGFYFTWDKQKKSLT